MTCPLPLPKACAPPRPAAVASHVSHPTQCSPSPRPHRLARALEAFGCRALSRAGPRPPSQLSGSHPELQQSPHTLPQNALAKCKLDHVMLMKTSMAGAHGSWDKDQMPPAGSLPDCTHDLPRFVAPHPPECRSRGCEPAHSLAAPNHGASGKHSTGAAQLRASPLKIHL